MDEGGCEVACVPARLSPAVMWGDKEETSIFSGSETNVRAAAVPCVTCPIITGFGHLLLPQSCAFHSWEGFLVPPGVQPVSGCSAFYYPGLHESA